MKNASDFRRIARDALKGMWFIAIVVGLVAALLGGTGSGGPEFNVNLESGEFSVEYAEQTIFSTNGGWNADIEGLIVGGSIYVLIVLIIFAVIYFILGSLVGVGYANFNLRLVDGLNPSFDTLFTEFPRWKTTAAAKLLRTVYVFLWTLLFIIPGIVAGYSYAMTDYILAEDPEISASEAIQRSKEMMSGNRWRLFCLQLSFIGWELLSSLTLGIGNLWLRPYKQAATAAFYREISGTERTAEQTAPEFI